VGKNELATLLPGMAIEGYCTVVIRLRGINKMFPSRGIHKDVRPPGGLDVPRGT
jgi:hypothetical protein